MPRLSTKVLGAAIAAALALPAGATGQSTPQSPKPAPYPSSQAGPGSGTGDASGQGGMGMGSGAGVGTGAGAGTGGGAGGSSAGGLGDVGSMNDPGSGAFNNNGAGAGDTGAGANNGAGAGGGNGGVAPGLGGIASAAAAPPGIIGDFEPISKAVVRNSAVHALASTRFPTLPTPVPPPVVKGNTPGIVSSNGTTSVLFKLTGLKISDNQSPRPQDRFFTSFNYFDDLNASVNKRLGSPIQNLQVYHELFGFEKTFFDGKASLGFRVPLNTISLKSTANIPGLGGSRTAPGDLSLFGKVVLYEDDKGNLISGGLQVSVPSGPGAFGGNKYYSYFRDTQIQPFIGYIFTRDRFYMQGFSSINVPTTSKDVTLGFTDVGVGYYAYRASEPNKFLTAIVPTAEGHLTTPLNHRGFNSNDLASTPDILNLTFGANMEFRHRAVITAAYVTPVTGPKPFNAEFVLLFNLRFGGLNRNRPSFPTTQ